MVILAATIAVQTPKRYEMAVKAALNVGVTPVEIKEILYQAVPYVGLLKVLDLLELTNKIFEEKGIKLPLEKQGTTNLENRFDKGLEVQKSIFGDVLIKIMKILQKIKFIFKNSYQIIVLEIIIQEMD